MTRTVKVKLTADHADLKTKLREGAQAAEKFGATTAKAALGATVALKGTEGAAEDLGDALDDVGDQGRTAMTSLAVQVKHLDRQIEQAENSVRDLAREFARTGDVKILDKIKSQRRDLAGLRDVRSMLPSAAELSGIGAQMSAMIGRGMASSGPLAAVGAGMAAGVVPLLSAAISAGVVGAAGGGGIIGGLVLASRDQRVASAAQAISERIMTQLEGSSGSMVDAALDALDEIEASIAGMSDDIGGIIDASAVNLEPLVGGVTGFLEAVIPKVRVALEMAKPIFDSLERVGPQLGDLIGDVLIMMAENAPAAALALEHLVSIIDVGVRALAGVMDFLTNVYMGAAKVGLLGMDASIQANSRSLVAGQDDVAGSADNAADSATGFARSLDGLAGSAGGAATEMRTLHEISRDMAEANISAAEAQINLRRAIKDAGKASDGRRGMSDSEHSALLDLARSANSATRALDEQGRTAEEAAESHRANRKALVDAAMEMGVSRKAARRLADSLLEVPKDVTPTVKLEGASAAQARIQAIKDALNRLPGTKTITINTRAEIPAGMSVRQLMEARGGTVTAMAAGGVYPASNPPLIKFAEPETGGELFVPRKGISRSRAQGLLAEGAAWYGMSVTPMASGGSLVAAAQGSLVNVAPSGGGMSGGRLDYLEAALSARDAVAGLTAALKENGRTWSVNTTKGRENRQALIGGIRAAQQAAQAKFEETGSIKAANAVYDDYLRKLDASMKKMGINAKARKTLLKEYSERPTFDVPASNSSARIRSVTDQIAAQQALGDAKTAFGWVKPTFDMKTATGQAELQQLFTILGAAEQAAQSLFAETGNSKTATALYNSYLTSLRATLKASGMSDSAINSLLNTYGRITLANRWGGVYERAAGGLTEAQIASGGPTRYAWAEPSTGGEAFIPRHGNSSRSLAIWQHVGERWLGQNVRGGGRSAPITVEATIPIVLGAETITRQVRIEVDAVVGQIVDATVYQTA
jgi:hypothetical protein